MPSVSYKQWPYCAVNFAAKADLLKPNTCADGCGAKSAWRIDERERERERERKRERERERG